MLRLSVTVPTAQEGVLAANPGVRLCIQNRVQDFRSYFLSRISLNDIRREDFYNNRINLLRARAEATYRNGLRECLSVFLGAAEVDRFVGSLQVTSSFAFNPS